MRKMDENKGKKIIEEQKTVTQAPSTNQGSKEMRKKLIRLMILVGGALIILLIVMFIISLISGKAVGYEKIEQQMTTAAKKYYEVQSSLLPTEEKGKIEVDVATLVEAEYMKPLKELRSKESCTGKVVVQKIDGKYIYTPFLNCGKAYQTKELYQELTEKTVTASDGLYQIGNEYVFRGETVNNYVQLDRSLFRIVKINQDQEIMLVLEKENGGLGYYYDNRYNSERGYNSGINDFRLSRIHEQLQETYEDETKESMLTINDKQHLVSFASCIGKRTLTSTDKTNQEECSDTLPNSMIGLLTASDYLQASLDSNCNATTDKACQNYNYLKQNYDWWLATALTNDTYQVLYVNTSGFVDKVSASATKKLRPTIMLSAQTMIKSGTGTASNPYILK